MKETEALEVISLLEKSYEHIGERSPHEFWEEIVNYSCLKNIGSKTRDLKDYIINDKELSNEGKLRLAHDVYYACRFNCTYVVVDDRKGIKREYKNNLEELICRLNVWSMGLSQTKELSKEVKALVKAQSEDLKECAINIRYIRDWLLEVGYNVPHNKLPQAMLSEDGLIYKEGEYETLLELPVALRKVEIRAELDKARWLELLTYTPFHCKWLKSKVTLAYFVKRISRKYKLGKGVDVKVVKGEPKQYQRINWADFEVLFQESNLAKYIDKKLRSESDKEIIKYIRNNFPPTPKKKKIKSQKLL